MQYISIILLLFMTGYIPRRCSKSLHGWLFLYCISTLLNNIGYLALMHVKTLGEAMLIWQVTYLGRVWIPYALLMFVIALCKENDKSIWTTILALFHVFIFFLVITMAHNHLYYRSFTFVEEGVFPHMERESGILHHVYDSLIVCYVIYGLAILLKTLKKTKNARSRKKLIFITFAVLTDVFFFVIQLFNPIPGYDITVLGYTLATVYFYIAIFAYDILETKTLAQNYVIEQVSEGIIAVNDDGSISFFNEKARAILPLLETEPQEALAKLDYLIENEGFLEYQEAEKDEKKKYTPKVNKLTDKNHSAGKVYILIDDTKHYMYAEKLTREMMFALSKSVEAKDEYTKGHSERVARYSREIARRLGKTEAEQEQIYEMGLLHDIGKIGVSKEIINKTSRLTDEEFNQIKEHTIIGFEILEQISAMPELAVGARWHHEKYNGTGYPDGLKGEEIPEAARIICVADCYDAMTSTRTYSIPKSQESVRAEFERCSGTQFDPKIAKIMLDMIDDDIDFTMNEKGSLKAIVGF
ncbi:MAG: HD domain-containing protein [Treponema sp.]|nr:HD domain-containing protein [Treponema sp.]